MNWLGAAFAAWFGWNVLAPLAFLLIVAAIMWASSVPRWLKQRRCPHKSYRETMACDAICNDCGLNLGFIGAVRERCTSTAPAEPGND